MGSKRYYESWPKFAQTMDGVSIEQRDSWPRVAAGRGNGSRRYEYSACDVYLRGYDVNGKDHGTDLGTVRIERDRVVRESDGKDVLTRAFRARYHPRHSGVSVDLGVGHCRDWKEAVEVLSMMDVVGAIRQIGRQIYTPRPEWLAVRPIKVAYPWRDGTEPNAVYSPFKLVGDYRLEDTDNGCVAMHYADTIAAIKPIAEGYGANALLVRNEEDPEGLLRLYHKPMGQMSGYDTITIEQLYARVLAGSEVDGY